MEVKLIIPCAGYGTRVNMKPHEAKEMLKYKNEKGRIIDYSLDLGKKLNLPILCISRQEKKEFNEYLENKKVEVIYDAAQKEWIDTIYESRHNWSDINILVLPDTRWSSKYKTIKDIVWYFENMNASMVYAVHKVKDTKNWGIISNSYLQEKPSHDPGSNVAFGLLAWKREEGEKFFQFLRDWKVAQFPENTKSVKLNWFKDITRKNENLK